MKIYHLDYESFSPANIKDVGAFRYAEDPGCEIMLCCIARGDEDPLLWDFTDPGFSQLAEELIEEMATGDGLIYAHNAQFETAVSRYKFFKTFGLQPPALDRWRCTASMARRASIPFSLGECGAFLKLPQQKDDIGKKLIEIFCCPQTRGKRKGERILPTDDVLVTLDGKKIPAWEAWKMFREYCINDVKTERHVHKSLKSFEIKGDVLDSFLLDLHMNHEGVPVNLHSIEQGVALSTEAAENETARFQEITGLVPTQRGKVQNWLNERGYDRDNLQEATITNRLENTTGMTPEAVEALAIRSRVSFAAVSKLRAMEEIACSDGKVRGAFMWAGALRTHRWAGRLIQPQNFRRPTIKNTHECYEHIESGMDLEMFSFLWGNPLEAIASCIRHFIHQPGVEFFDVDFANIEARITPWLAGQEDLLQSFRDGGDPYIDMAAFIFSKENKDVTKDERFVGKQAILGAGFQIGWEKYQTMCAGYGVHLSDEVCKLAVQGYRDKNSKIVSMWKLMQQAAVNAIENPGQTFTVRDKIRFTMSRTLPYSALVMQLPSGHCLFYPLPDIRVLWMFQKNKYETEEQANNAYDRAKKRGTLEEGDRVWSSKAISFYGQEPVSKRWMRRDTYGGKLLENCVAGDMEVLTEIGWKRIDEITNELVFDGVEFVSHNGLKKTEGVSTISVDGLRVTGEHLVLTPQGWVEAQNVKIEEAYKHFICHFWSFCSVPAWVTNAKMWVQTERMEAPVLVFGEQEKGEEKTAGHKEPVYDILNCGPRNRFVVRGPNKKPVIVHNCVQAVAGDFMAIGARAAQKAGYRVFMLVHDQALAYFEPEKGQSVEEFESLICTLPAWASDFPLKAECDLVPFYTKV